MIVPQDHWRLPGTVSKAADRDVADLRLGPIAVRLQRGRRGHRDVGSRSVAGEVVDLAAVTDVPVKADPRIAHRHAAGFCVAASPAPSCRVLRPSSHTAPNPSPHGTA